jgi:hypothetical protein
MRFCGAGAQVTADLLGGAQRGRTRPRGFVEWKPHAASLALLDQVRGVLSEYAAFLPLTCRQVFYRLVGAHGYDKTERAPSAELLESCAQRATLAGISVEAWNKPGRECTVAGGVCHAK